MQPAGLKPVLDAPRGVALRVWTVGHSTRTADEFIALLRQHGIRTLVDIRTVPRSRRVPWTGIDALPQVLSRAGIDYAHLEGLGGLRKPRKDSPNDAWRNEGFRGYADHMRSRDFERALDELIGIAAHAPACVMCAEAVPWRCHRGLLADALVVRGVEVLHILDAGAKPHVLTSFAKVDGTAITYPAGPGEQSRLPVQGDAEKT